MPNDLSKEEFVVMNFEAVEEELLPLACAALLPNGLEHRLTQPASSSPAQFKNQHLVNHCVVKQLLYTSVTCWKRW